MLIKIGPIFIIILASLIHFRSLGFTGDLVKTGNFVVDLLVDERNTAKQLPLIPFFKKYFRFDFQKSADNFKMIELIITEGPDSFVSLNTEMEEQDIQNIGSHIKDRLVKILVKHENTVVRSLITKNKKSDKSFDILDREIRDLYIDILSFYVKNYVYFQYTFNEPATSTEFKQQPQLNGNFEKYAAYLWTLLRDERIIDDAIVEFLKECRQCSSLLKLPLRNYLKGMKRVYHDENIDYVRQYIKFRSDYRSQLAEALTLIFNAVKNKRYVVTADDKIGIMNLIQCIVSISEDLSSHNMRKFINNYVAKSLLPNRDSIGENNFNDLFGQALDALKGLLVDSNIKDAIEILLTYALKGEIIEPNSFSRASIISQKYRSLKIIADPSIINHKQARNIVQLYNVEVLYASYFVQDFKLDHRDLGWLLSNYRMFESFSRSKLSLMNDLDSFFDRALAETDLFQEYNSLHNVFIFMASQQSESVPLYANLIDKVDHFLNYLFLNDEKVDILDFNIKENYVYFKLINYFDHISHFKNAAIKFHHYENTNPMPQKKLEVLLPGLRDLIRYMKSTQDKIYTLANENFFSDLLIEPAVTRGHFGLTDADLQLKKII